MPESNKTSEKQNISFTYDSKITSSAEIIAPGINLNQPDLAIQALRQGMVLAETKDCIETVTGGCTEFAAEQAEAYLQGAAALLKERRKNKQLLAKTQDSASSVKKLNDYTADDINKINSDFWAKR